MYPVTESKTVYQGIIVDVKIDDVTYPNGQNFRREVVLQKGSAAILLVDNEGKILMVRQYRHPIGRETLEVPAGILEAGEEPLACIVREAEEETGYIPQDVRFVCAVHSSIGISTEEVHIYIGNNLKESAQKLDVGEFITIERYSLDDCLKMVKSGEITAAQTVVALFAYNIEQMK